MFIVGIDTSGRSGSIALARVDERAFEVIAVVPLAGRSYSAQLVPELAKLLEQNCLTKQDVGALAVASGPGSFTGLRVGLASVKALAETLHAAIAAVSVLEEIAAQTKADGRVIAALDAGRGELFVGEYDVVCAQPKCVRESLLTRAEFAALLEAHSAAELITPDTTVADLAPIHLHLEQIESPDAGEIARLGYLKIQAGQTVAPEELDANYIRRSDAEIFAPKL